MKKTWIELLHELPVDTTLREFLTGHGLNMPDDLAWTDLPETTQALIDALVACPDAAVRDPVAAKLRASVALGDSAGTQAMFQVAAGNGAVLTSLATCKSDTHRSFWLYVKHPDLFDRAGDVDHFERQVAHAQQHDLGVKKTPDTSDAALAALRADVSAFYQREMQCGDRSKAYVVQRSPSVYLLSVHIKDLSMVHLEFEGDDLKRRVGNPNIHSVLEYSAITGVTRSLVKGGAKYHQMLLKAFAEHLLHVKVDAHRLMPPTLDLSVLRLGFDVPQAEVDGFNVLQVKSISLLSPDTQLKVDCTAMASSEHRCVTDLLAEKLPGPLAENWLVTGAHINLYYPPEPGKTRPKVVTIEVTRKGRLNLHKFDAALQAQLEGYLVSLGILQKGQTLNPQETPPSEDVHDLQPAFEQTDRCQLTKRGRWSAACSRVARRCSRGCAVARRDQGMLFPRAGDQADGREPHLHAVPVLPTAQRPDLRRWSGRTGLPVSRLRPHRTRRRRSSCGDAGRGMVAVEAADRTGD